MCCYLVSKTVPNNSFNLIFKSFCQLLFVIWPVSTNTSHIINSSWFTGFFIKDYVRRYCGFLLGCPFLPSC